LILRIAFQDIAEDGRWRKPPPDFVCGSVFERNEQPFIKYLTQGI
ncbi:MAG: hypothetical protein ACI9U6_001184, partial [Loktanella salsilacus]